MARGDFGRWGVTILRRGASFLLTLVVTFVGLTAVTFFISRLTNIDPVLGRYRRSCRARRRTTTPIGRSASISRSSSSISIYLKRLVTGDFGMSVLTSQPVLSDLLRVFPATFELATIAIVIGVLLGVPVGVIAAANKGRWPDHVIRVVGLFGYSVPVFWLGLVGLFVFYGKLGWVGGPGRLDVFYRGRGPSRTGVILIDAAIAGNWEIVRQRLQPPGPAGEHPRLLLAGLYRPHDAQLHDRPAEPGVRHGGADQGQLVLGCGLAPRVPQHHGAADHRRSG